MMLVNFFLNGPLTTSCCNNKQLDALSQALAEDIHTAGDGPSADAVDIQGRDRRIPMTPMGEARPISRESTLSAENDSAKPITYTSYLDAMNVPCPSAGQGVVIAKCCRCGALIDVDSAYATPDHIPLDSEAILAHSRVCPALRNQPRAGQGCWKNAACGTKLPTFEYVGIRARAAADISAQFVATQCLKRNKGEPPLLQDGYGGRPPDYIQPGSEYGVSPSPGNGHPLWEYPNTGPFGPFPDNGAPRLADCVWRQK